MTTSNDCWTLDEIEQLMRIMGENDCTDLEIGDIKIRRHLKIELPAQTEGKEPTDEEILENPYAGL